MITVTETARDYEHRVRRLAEQSYRQTLFVRDCKRLLQFLESADRQSETRQDLIDFAKLYSLQGGGSPVGYPLFPNGFPAWTKASNKNCLLFLSGYPSARLLLEIGGHFDIDPTFFDTHLSYLKGDISSCSMHPSYYSLPSQRQMIFQTTIDSIAGAPEDTGYCNLSEKIDSVASKMEQYVHGLRMGLHWKPFQSVVRAMDLYDAQRFSLQQNVTILIKRPKDDKSRWLAVVWSDVGSELVRSPRGPWLDSTWGASNIHFRPVNLRRSEITPGRLDHKQTSGNTTERVDLHQSATLLPKRYGASLDPQLMAADPVYSLAELLTFISTSEAQYLDMIKSVLDDILTTKQQRSSKNINKVRVTLNSCYRGLEYRRDRIEAMIDFLRPQADIQSPEGLPITLSIIRDNEYLYKKANQLMSRFDHEWNIIMSEAAVENAQWSKDLSRT